MPTYNNVRQPGGWAMRTRCDNCNVNWAASTKLACIVCQKRTTFIEKVWLSPDSESTLERAKRELAEAKKAWRQERARLMPKPMRRRRVR